MSGGSVYQRVLGAQFAELEPRLQRYFGPIPQGSVGRGQGVYAIAGSRCRVLRPVWSFLAWRRILFPEYAIDVPFTIRNTADASALNLSARRTFAFASRERVMLDTMSVVDGQLIDRLGARGGLEVALTLAVHHGGLTMRSGRLRLRIFGMWIPLPRIVTMTLEERTDPMSPERQHVDVRLTAPMLGEIFRYTGSFTYAHVSV